MESTISHYLASVFTSVSKRYRKSNHSYYVSNKKHHVNSVDLSKLYIQLLHCKEENDKFVIKYSLDFSISEHITRGQGKASIINYIKEFMTKYKKAAYYAYSLSI